MPGRADRSIRTIRGRSSTPSPSGTSAIRNPSRYSSTAMSLMWVVNARGASASTVSIGSSSRAMLLPVSKADPDMIVAGSLQHGEQLVGPQVLVVLDGEQDAVPRDDRAGEPQRVLGPLGEPPERVGRGERLVPPPREASHGTARPTPPGLPGGPGSGEASKRSRSASERGNTATPSRTIAAASARSRSARAPASSRMPSPTWTEAAPIERAYSTNRNGSENRSASGRSRSPAVRTGNEWITRPRTQSSRPAGLNLVGGVLANAAAWAANPAPADAARKRRRVSRMISSGRERLAGGPAALAHRSTVLLRSTQVKGRLLPFRGASSMKHFTRITMDPAVMGGKACIRGMRVTVGTIIGLLAAGRSRQEILKAYPYLEEDDLDQALAYAAWRVEEREVELTPV